MEYSTRARSWTRAEYERLIEVGVFRPGEPLELLGGQMIVAEPQGSAHHTALGLVEDALRVAFGTGWLVRSQGPIALDDESEPEPDVAVAPGSRRDYSRAHPAGPSWSSRLPSRVWLLIESTKGASMPGLSFRITGS